MLFSHDDKTVLLQPISPELFCGQYLKGDKAAFRPLRNAFNVAQTSLRKLSQNPDGNELEALQDENLENWRVLAEQLMHVFKTSSRDIELIGWFLAAQLQLDPSASSFSLTLEWLAQLLEDHWDEINPCLPADKLKSESEQGKKAEQAEAKSKAFFQWLGDSEESSLLYAPVLALPIVSGITFFQYQSAERKGEVGALKQQATAVVSHERSDIQRKLDNLNSAMVALEKMAALANTRSQALGVVAPNFNFVKSLLHKLDNAILHLTGLKHSSVAQSAVSSNATAQATSNEPVSEVSQPVTQSADTLLFTSGHLQVSASNNFSQTAQMNSLNRDLAFHQLREISDYFRQSEPHSPISFLLEKAIRWGYLSLPELLQEMMSGAESGSLDKIFHVAGLDHSDQVLLPDVTQHAVGIQQPSITPVSATEPQMKPAEVKAAEASPSAAPLNQKTEKEKPAGSTALRW
ncbi:type VI secretion system ImpA family N-terminal domain-containing protein [Vibrio cidicii]|nr:type VI secretion system ImpA family N-terminal domain-containing protein [Vibrio cidicii]